MLQTPRRSYASRVALREQSSIKMMTALDSGRVGLIKREFEARGGSVDMFEFVRIMEANLPEHLYDDLNSAAAGALAVAAPVTMCIRPSRSRWPFPARRSNCSGLGKKTKSMVSSTQAPWQKCAEPWMLMAI